MWRKRHNQAWKICSCTTLHLHLCMQQCHVTEHACVTQLQIPGVCVVTRQCREQSRLILHGYQVQQPVTHQQYVSCMYTVLKGVNNACEQQPVHHDILIGVVLCMQPRHMAAANELFLHPVVIKLFLCWPCLSMNLVKQTVQGDSSTTGGGSGGGSHVARHHKAYMLPDTLSSSHRHCNSNDAPTACCCFTFFPAAQTPEPPAQRPQLEKAIVLIDEANSQDPTRIPVDGEQMPYRSAVRQSSAANSSKEQQECAACNSCGDNSNSSCQGASLQYSVLCGFLLGQGCCSIANGKLVHVLCGPQWTQ